VYLVVFPSQLVVFAPKFSNGTRRKRDEVVDGTAQPLCSSECGEEHPLPPTRRRDEHLFRLGSPATITGLPICGRQTSRAFPGPWRGGILKPKGVIDEMLNGSAPAGEVSRARQSMLLGAVGSSERGRAFLLGVMRRMRSSQGRAFPMATVAGRRPSPSETDRVYPSARRRALVFSRVWP
jgi:hypothetical protein